jgi:tRNA pseudouridine13 synthase
VDVPEGPVRTLVERTLAERGLTLEALDVKHPRGSFFSKGWRPAVLMPLGVAAESANDDLYAGKRRVTLSFDLPRGAYATILVKRLTAIPAAPPVG